MKRSLIAWDEKELPPATLERRLARARAGAASVDAGLDALVVYTDLYRASAVRTLVNFIPYWGASLLVVPIDGETVLLCGNSPRVYPWLRTVSFVNELRPSKDLGAALAALGSERAWKRLGVFDLARLPYGLHRGFRDAPLEHELELELVDLPSRRLLGAPDEAELAMRRHAASVTRKRVEEAVAEASRRPEHWLVARLEAVLRGGGMTDTFIRLSDGAMPPRPASGRLVTDRTSVVVATDYRGHWVSIARPVDAAGDKERVSFLTALRGEPGARAHRFDLGGDGPFAPLPPEAPLERGQLVAVHLELSDGRLYGDSCIVGEGTSLELL